MSTTLSYGYILPATGDKGSSFFPDLESNITRLNGHTHDGSDSAPISVQDLTKFTQTILAASWDDDTGGNYSQTVTMPTGIDMTSYIMQFYINSGADDGDLVHPVVEIISANSYKVHTNDNTLEYRVIYI